MLWSEEMVLEFIQNYESEPIIWNPKDACNKKKSLVRDAWHRVKGNLTFGNSTGVEELKKKKDSLMAYYRFHLNKIKNSKQSGNGAEEIYKTNWFAFSAMHRFLAPVYECSTSVNTEKINDHHGLSSQSNNTDDDDSSISSYKSETDITPIKKRQRGIPDLLVAKKQKNKHYARVREKTFLQQPDHVDECDLYVQLLAQKLKKISEDRRVVLMHEIDNLVFQAIMTVKSEKY